MSLPTVKLEQRIVVGVEVPRQADGDLVAEDEGGPIEARPPHDPEAKRGARVRYANGVTVVHGGPSGSTFIGTKGMIHIDRGRSTANPNRIFKKPIGDDELAGLRQRDVI